jgi:hypothetical protein
MSPIDSFDQAFRDQRVSAVGVAQIEVTAHLPKGSKLLLISGPSPVASRKHFRARVFRASCNVKAEQRLVFDEENGFG